MVRKILGIIAGAAVCNFAFVGLAIGLTQGWPAYAAHARTYMQQRLFTFTPAMAACNLLLWAVAAFAAGFVAMKIAQTQRAVQVLAVLVVAYAAATHLILRWASFPWWYNLGVVLLLGSGILVGARLCWVQERDLSR